MQRVSRASVAVEGERVAEIGPGLLVLLGVGVKDTDAEADRLAGKVRALRIFDDADGRMNEPLGEREVLCVSQFTLYADAQKGNRPSYVTAAPPEAAEPLQLVQPEVLYEFADPKLETLSAGQKILLRVGKTNRDKLKAKLAELRQALVSLPPKE